MKMIGLCGVARCGKDSFAQAIIDHNPKLFKKHGFAYELKNDLNDFLLTKLGISAFTENLNEKEIIRPLLICWGTDVIRNNYDKTHWIKKIKNSVDKNFQNGYTTIITDVRFTNELDWIKQNSGKTIYISRKDCFPTGEIEKETESLVDNCDCHFYWGDICRIDEDAKKHAINFFNKNIWLNNMQT